MNLKLGDSGNQVMTLQLSLAKLGYPLKGTGYFGPATNTAVEDFQRKFGLEVDGIVGPEVMNALGQGVVTKESHPEITYPLWLQAALKWVGTREQPGSADSQVILNWAKDQGGSMEDIYTHDAIPWCALFANEVLWQSSLKGTGTLWALDFARWGQKLVGPAVGAFAPMKRNGGGHITIVVGKDRDGNLMCVGGNQSDAVNVKPFDPSRVVSYRWPSGVALPSIIGLNALPIIRSDGKLSKNEA